MKRFFLMATLVAFLFPASVLADTITLEISAVTPTYTLKLERGVTEWERSERPDFGDGANVSATTAYAMSFSGTSVCSVIDLSDMDIDGKFTFQFKMLAGVTGVPDTGATISVHWRGSDIDSEDAWIAATKNTIVDAIDVYTGATNVGYDINDITGVTPFQFMRFEFESGVSVRLDGESDVRPIGLLHIR